MLHKHESSWAYFAQNMPIRSSLCLLAESQTASFEHQDWHTLLLSRMHISTQRHSHCSQETLSTVKSFHSGLVAQQMIVSINFLNDMLHSTP